MCTSESTVTRLLLLQLLLSAELFNHLIEKRNKEKVIVAKDLFQLTFLNVFIMNVLKYLKIVASLVAV